MSNEVFYMIGEISCVLISLACVGLFFKIVPAQPSHNMGLVAACNLFFIGIPIALLYWAHGGEAKAQFLMTLMGIATPVVIFGILLFWILKKNKANNLKHEG